MDVIVTKARARIWGNKNAWSLSADSGLQGPSQECVIALEIQGDAGSGFHLVMSPSGFFSADHWYETKEDALRDAEVLFAVWPQDWVPKPDD